jgi:hypothetical protein
VAKVVRMHRGCSTPYAARGMAVTTARRHVCGRGRAPQDAKVGSPVAPHRRRPDDGGGASRGCERCDGGGDLRRTETGNRRELEPEVGRGKKGSRVRRNSPGTWG